MNLATWINDAMALTQEQAELNRYRVGVWTQEQYEAFMHVWARNKISGEAMEWNGCTPHSDVRPLVDMLSRALALADARRRHPAGRLAV